MILEILHILNPKLNFTKLIIKIPNFPELPTAADECQAGEPNWISYMWD